MQICAEHEIDDEDRCELYHGDERGDRCPNRATQQVEEPWTPGRFKQSVCDECAASRIRAGYKPVPQESRYRIEKRNDTEPTRYWCREYEDWHREGESGSCTIYTEAERKAFLDRELRGEPNKFPAGGIWVRLEAERKAAA